MEKKLLVYISHPYGGKQENIEKIEEIITELCRHDDVVENAIFVSPVHNYGFMYKEFDYEKGIGICLDLLSKCDMMLLFGNWEASRGCKMEYEFCQSHNILVKKIKDIEELRQFI